MDTNAHSHPFSFQSRTDACTKLVAALLVRALKAVLHIGCSVDV
jgi:hypothetical protein